VKALTISQPWASLIASGEKWIENRTWSTNYKGPLAIHAGLGTQYLNKAELKKYPSGCVIAIVDLEACVPLQLARVMNASYARSIKVDDTQRTWLDVARNEYAEGPYCWILGNLRKLDEPIPAVGKQGLWEWVQPDVLRVS